jgi:hypothetical protein
MSSSWGNIANYLWEGINEALWPQSEQQPQRAQQPQRIMLHDDNSLVHYHIYGDSHCKHPQHKHIHINNVAYTPRRNDRNDDEPRNQQSLRVGGTIKNENPTIIEIKYNGGTVNHAYDNYRNSNDKVCIIVAGNHGRPGGNIGHNSPSIIDGHYCSKDEASNKYTCRIRGGQEESIMRSWLAASNNSGQQINQLKKIHNHWGLTKALGISLNNKTIQGVDYTRTKNEHRYGDAWYLNNIELCAPTSVHSQPDMSRKIKSDLVFVAGPNVSDVGRGKGSMKRTRNQRAYDGDDSYNFFKNCIKFAMIAAFESAIANDVDVLYIAGLSTNIYAGRYQGMIGDEFIDICQSAAMHRGNGYNILKYFKKVYYIGVPGIEQPLPGNKRARTENNVDTNNKRARQSLSSLHGKNDTTSPYSTMLLC